MAGDERMHDEHDCGGDAAAYALGALEPDEVAAFERHMSTCIVCRDEVAALTQVVAALPMAAPQYPAPDTLRRRTLHAVRAEARVSAPDTAQRRRARRPVLWRPQFAVPGALLAAAAVALILVLGTGGGGGSRVVAADLGAAVLRVSNDHGELIVRHLPPPPAGHIYEVWLRRGQGAPQPTRTLFSVTAADTGDVGLPGSMRGIDEVMVTPERAGGSPVPTHPPVIDVKL